MKKRQHYVPQCYLNNFTDNKGLLHIYDYKHTCYFTQIPRNVCYEKNLYETEWQDANPKLGKYVLSNNIEDIFCAYEGQFAELLKIIQKACIPQQNPRALILHTEEKKILVKFLINLLVRNPVYMSAMGIDELTDDLKNNDEILIYKEIMDKMGFGGGDSIVLASQKKVMLTDEFKGGYMEDFFDMIKNINYTFYYAKSGEYITSNVPVCYGDDQTISGDNKSCLALALTPKVLVLFGNYKESVNYRNRMIIIKADMVDEFNRQMVRARVGQHMLIGSNEALIKRYVEE